MLGWMRRLRVTRHVSLLALASGAGTAALCYYEPGAPTPERLARWADKWEANDIKFHKRDVHPTLVAHIGALFPDAPAAHRVLVPLCGKTVDMPFLARAGHEVVGVEGVPLAAEAFSKDQPHLRMVRCAPGAPAGAAAPADFIAADAFAGPRAGYVFTTRDGKLGYHRDRPQPTPAAAATQPAAAPAQRAALGERADWLSTGGTAAARADQQAQRGTVWLAIADWFDVRRDEIGSFGRAWDRGGLVAVPPAARPAYASALDALLEPRARVLLSCFDYDQQVAPGPPFALAVDDVRALFPRYSVRVLARTDASAEFRKRVGTPWEKIERMDELALLLVKRRPWWRRVLWPFGDD